MNGHAEAILFPAERGPLTAPHGSPLPLGAHLHIRNRCAGSEPLKPKRLRPVSVTLSTPTGSKIKSNRRTTAATRSGFSMKITAHVPQSYSNNFGQIRRHLDLNITAPL